MAFRWGLWGGLAAAAVLVTSAAARMQRDPLSDLPHWQRELPASAATSILSYNVEGLPWPVAWGRSDAARHIAEDLKSLRERGTQPHIVAVQEAFGADQKAIGQEAGYAFAAYGPSATDAPEVVAAHANDSFAAGARALKGETEGAYADSGLAVFSDYPILWVRRVAYPRSACAGYDCLANKGALMVAVQVPGRADPVVVVDTHLNSRAASKVSDARSGVAFARQVETLHAFIAREAPAGATLLLAGDYNVGSDKTRIAAMETGLLQPLGLRLAAVELSCGKGCRRAISGDLPGGNVIRSRSLVGYRMGAADPLRPYADIATFGAAETGEMLSDHIGLTVGFS